MMSTADAFRQEIAQAGLTPPVPIIADGKLHRFASNGDRADDAGWYLYFPDEVPAGAFGCWRTGLKQTWSSKADSMLTPAERARQRRRLDEARRQREQEERLRHAEAKKRAQTIWDQAASAPEDHPHLQRKGVQPHGVRVDDENRLLVPVTLNGTLCSLQFIDMIGGKQFLAGGAVKGGSYTIGEMRDAAIIGVGEGFSTCASVNEATGYPTVCAFSANNLTLVAQQLRQRFPTATILICGDNDLHDDGKPNTGLDAAEGAADAVHGVLAVPELDGRKCDFNDLAQTQGHDAVKDAIAAALKREETQTMATATAGTVEADVQADSWPQLDAMAIRGVLGDLVRAIEPHSEADVVALFIQGLIAFGSTLNRAAYFSAEADRHHMNLNAVMVGETAKVRKRTSWGYVRRIFAAVDPDWATTRVLNGLSSGEGLIWAVRDEITKDEPVREKGRPTGEYQTVVVDRGITDKRLLVLESEFASTLRVKGRDGNTLSAVIRQAWDFGDLRTMTKNCPAQATGAHISIIAHITKDELCRLIEASEASNGFCNRFLWLCVKRSKSLPEGGLFDETALAPLIQRLHAAVRFGRGTGELRRDEGARAIWLAVYPELSEGKPGLLGAVISRGEAQVMRLACLYALQDMSYVVTPDHLTAALALWEYCEASAKYIFGQRLGDPIADELLTALRKRPTGMTRTEIRDWFGRNRRAHEIDRGLTLLAKQGLARKEESQSGGRPIERWFSVSKATT
jgi:phage/plasmid primase-like uncharacterized protein